MGIDIAKLVAATENPAQSQSILSMMEQAVEFMKKVDSIVTMCQKWGLSPSIVEKIAIKYGELDKVPSLPDSTRGIVPATATHQAIFVQLNELSDTDLIALSKKIQEAEKEKK